MLIIQLNHIVFQTNLAPALIKIRKAHGTSSNDAHAATGLIIDIGYLIIISSHNFLSEVQKLMLKLLLLGSF